MLNNSKGVGNAVLITAIIIVIAVCVTAGFIATQLKPAEPTPTATPEPSPTAILPTATPSPIPTTQSTPEPTSQKDPYANSTHVLLQTSKGDITLALRNDMPITTGNFINLITQGAYDGSTFHRVISDFMIQGGQLANGSVAPNIQDEFTTTNHNYNGTIAMANTGAKNSGSSQFFINTADNNNRYSTFDSSYPVFGKVIAGMDVVMAISHVATDANDRPLQEVRIISATVLRTRVLL